MLVVTAGLLTYLRLTAFPPYGSGIMIRPLRLQKELVKVVFGRAKGEIYSSGTVQDLHLIPF